MAQEKFAVRLSEEDRSQLEGLIRSGQRSARVINRARILLKTYEGWSASQVATALDTSPRTVFRTKRRYAEEGLYGVLHDHPQADRYRKLDDRGEAHPVSSTGQALIALACSDAPIRPGTTSCMRFPCACDRLPAFRWGWIGWPCGSDARAAWAGAIAYEPCVSIRMAAMRRAVFVKCWTSSGFRLRSSTLRSR